MQVEIEFSPSLFVSKKKDKDRVKDKDKDNAKQPKERKLTDILRAVCGILNTSKQGGKLILFSKDGAYTDKDADNISRTIEQILEGTFGGETTNEFFHKIPKTDYSKEDELHYNIVPVINSPGTLFTVKYNLYRTSNTQVRDTPSFEQLERVVGVINGGQTREIKQVLGKHYKTFRFGEQVFLEESKEIQFKCFDDKCTKKCNLVTRMMSDSNKLVRYVAAFANGSGGHIYCGIKLDDSGVYVAYGQKVGDKEFIINQVEKAIKELLVWPGTELTEECFKKGQQWDIFFEKVSGIEEPKYVIVISVNSQDRGVFTRKPESYVIDTDGKVKPMELREWVERLRLFDYRDIFSHEELPEVVARFEWSSPEAFQNHLKLLEELVIFRNDGHEDEFIPYKNKVLKSCDGNGNIECLFQQQEAANFFRKGDLNKAEEKLNKNEKFLNETPQEECKDKEILHTRRLYWLAVVKRAQGDYEKCLELCIQALQKSHNQPAGLVLPWIHYCRAKVLEIDIAKEQDFTKERDLRMKCLEHYESAVRSSFALSKFPQKLVTNLKYRVFIGMIRILLGAFYDGTEVVHKKCLPSDIKYADHLFKVVDDSVKKLGLSMGGLNKAEYRLVRAEQYYLDWRESSCPKLMEKAYEQSKKALEGAVKGNFQQVIDFAQGQIKIFDIMSKMRIR